MIQEQIQAEWVSAVTPWTLHADPEAWVRVLSSPEPPSQWSALRRATTMAELGVTQPDDVSKALCQLVREGGAETLRMGCWPQGRAAFRKTTRNRELVKLVLQQVQPFLQGRGISAVIVQQKPKLTEKLRLTFLAVCLLGPSFQILEYCEGFWRVRFSQRVADTGRNIWAAGGHMYSRIPPQDRPGFRKG